MAGRPDFLLSAMVTIPNHGQHISEPGPFSCSAVTETTSACPFWRSKLSLTVKNLMKHDVDKPVGLTLTNYGRARESTEGHVHYLDRLAAEDAARDPILKVLKFIKRYAPWFR